MAILTSRAIQDLLDEATAFLNQEQGQSLVRRLNTKDSTALEAEWELIILSALYREGDLVHEPLLGGSSKLDFSFEHADTGLKVAGDVTALSDDAIERSTTGYLTETLIKRLDKEDVHGQISIEFDYEESADAIRPRLPFPQEFSRYVFGAEFQEFVRAVRANPSGIHHMKVNNAKAGLWVSYAPGPWRHTMRSRNIRMPRNPAKNVVYNALQDKKDQIKKSGHLQKDGLRCIVLCDGACAALTMRKSWETQSKNEIVPTFLAKTKSVDIVACVSVQDATVGSSSKRKFEFAVDVFERPNLGVAGYFQMILEEALNQLPSPVCNVVSAKRHIERKFGPFFIYDGARGSSYGVGHFEVSSRAVFDYLTGRIDHEKFERVIGPHPLEIFRRELDAGRMVVELKLKPDPERDDDTVVIRLGERDAAAGQFTFPAEGGDAKERG
jgi:hypothetical protein